MDSNIDLLLQMLQEDPSLLDRIGDEKLTDINAVLGKQAEVAGKYAREPTSTFNQLGQDKWGTILASKGPLEISMEGMRKGRGYMEERGAMQKQMANLLRQKENAQALVGALQKLNAGNTPAGNFDELTGMNSYQTAHPIESNPSWQPEPAEGLIGDPVTPKAPMAPRAPTPTYNGMPDIFGLRRKGIL